MAKALQTNPSRWIFARERSAICRLVVYVIVLLAAVIANNQLWAQNDSGSSAYPAFSDSTAELLSVEEAFTVSVEENDAGTFEVLFDITPGHYLYRDKIDVISESADVSIAQISKPQGIETEDAFFGRTLIYREPTSITVGANQTGASNAISDQMDIAVLYQGCSDVGICYPPQTKLFSVALPALNEEPAGHSGSIGLDLKSSLNLGTSVPTTNDQTPASSPVHSSNSNTLQTALADPSTSELLPPDVAFMISVAKTTSTGIDINFFAEPGYYLYKDKISFALEDANNTSISDTRMPTGLSQFDEFFGDVEVYRGSVIATAMVTTSVAPSDANLIIGYQGCADIGVCFPPQTTVLPVNLSGIALNSSTDTGPSDRVNNATSAPPSANGITENSNASTLTQIDSKPKTVIAMSEQDRLATTLSTSSIGLVVLTFFGLGLLLAFTPCVFPMIPILSSIIAGQGKDTSPRKAFSLSLVYVLAMAFTYTIAGVFIGLSGENVQIWFQNPYVLSAFALVFVLLSLSMFGFYELQMPASIQNKLNRLSNKQQGGSYYGVAIMGFLSALVVGPCVTAPLVGALIFIADTGDALVGGTALFALSMGMGAPLLLIGTSFGTWLPKSGKWMEITKAFFGVMLLALAIWMLSRFLSAQITLFLSALLAIVTAVFMGALDRTSETTAGWRKLAKGGGIALILYGAALLMGAFAGGDSLLRPLDSLSNSYSISNNQRVETSDEIHFQTVKTTAELDTLLAKAAANNQSVMLDFYADWCVSCKEMEAFTFSDTVVQTKLKGTITLQADVTANDNADKAMLKRFGLFGPPGIIFYRPDGTEVREARVVGFMSSDKFANHLDTHLAAN